MTDPILYVGDSLDIKQILNESSKKIDAVQNGMIALNALSDSANKYSAVIIEDQLPLMDPSNLIKQLEHYSKTPIIAIVRSDKRRSEILNDFEMAFQDGLNQKGLQLNILITYLIAVILSSILAEDLIKIIAYK